MADSPNEFHKWAKDAGNKLRAYILSYASAATGVFFLALTGKGIEFDPWDKWLVAIALLLYVATTVLCLVELNIDARRFYYVAQQLERDEIDRDWSLNARYKATRLLFLYGSYTTAGLATLAVLVYLLRTIW